MTAPGVTLDDLPDVLSIPELCHVLRCSRRLLQRMREHVCVPEPLPLIGHPRWSKAEVCRWIEHRDARRGFRRLR